MQQDTADTAGRRPLIIAIAHQKGGSGKTTTTCNLAVGMAARLAPRRVGVLDLDPQASASHHLGLPDTRGSMPVAGSFELLSGRRTLAEVLRPTTIDGVVLIAANHRLTLAEVDPVLTHLSHHTLRERLSGPAADDLACILIDCAPGFGVFGTVALMAADLVVVPTPPRPFAEAALRNTIHYVESLRADGRHRLAILPTMVDAADPLQVEIEARLRADWHDQVFATSIPYDPGAETAVAAGMPIARHAPASAMARAYEDSAQELLEALGPAVGATTAPPRPDTATQGLASAAPVPPPAPPATRPAPVEPAPVEPDAAAPDPLDEEPLVAADPPPPWVGGHEVAPPRRRQGGCMGVMMVFAVAVLIGAALVVVLMIQGDLGFDDLSTLADPARWQALFDDLVGPLLGQR